MTKTFPLRHARHQEKRDVPNTHLCRAVDTIERELPLPSPSLLCKEAVFLFSPAAISKRASLVLPRGEKRSAPSSVPPNIYIWYFLPVLVSFFFSKQSINHRAVSKLVVTQGVDIFPISPPLPPLFNCRLCRILPFFPSSRSQSCHFYTTLRVYWVSLFSLCSSFFSFSGD